MLVYNTVPLIQDVEDSDRIAFPSFESYFDHIPVHKPGRTIDTGIMVTTLLHVTDDDRLSRSKHLARNPLVPRDRCAARYRLLSDRVIEDQSLYLRVCQENRTCVRAHFVHSNAQGRLDQLVNLGVLKDVLADPASRF